MEVLNAVGLILGIVSSAISIYLFVADRRGRGGGARRHVAVAAIAAATCGLVQPVRPGRCAS